LLYEFGDVENGVMIGFCWGTRFEIEKGVIGIADGSAVPEKGLCGHCLVLEVVVYDRHVGGFD